MKKRIAAAIVLALAGGFLLLSIRDVSEPRYGASFSRLHAEELGLPWKEAYRAVLDDLGVRAIRLSAHWSMVEEERDVLVFDDLDYQMKEAERRGAEVILAVGRRLPGWPECHDPAWAENLSHEERQVEVLSYIEEVVLRYKDSPALSLWQVENEPFLTTFAYEHCGELGVSFLEREITLVKSLDLGREVVLTDSGELGRWYGAWVRGDVFGTTIYLYISHPVLGEFRYPIPPSFVRAKRTLVELLSGERDKRAILIELAAEPWLLTPIADAPLEKQLSRMDIDKLKETLRFAAKTGFEEQYLWGVEWWYYMKGKGHPEFWEEGKRLFGGESSY